MKKNKKIPMTFHLWRDFAMFAIIIMALLWLLQIFFLNNFYEGMKKDEIEKTGNELVEYYYSDREVFEDTIKKYSMGRGMFVNLLDSDGNVLMRPEPMEEFKHRPSHGDRDERNRIANFNHDNWDKFVEKVSSSDSKTCAYVLEADIPVKMMIFGAELKNSGEDKVYLYISSAIEPIDTTRHILQNQLAIVSVIALFLAFVVAYFIAKKFSKPIESMTIGAKMLAEGKYDTQFEGGAYAEMSELASVLNDTSDKLAKTDELRRDLMANVSHDLKTPLTIIRSYSEMIRDISGDNKEKREAHTQVIIDEANRLTLLVDDILKLSRLESGALLPEKKDFDISSLCRSIVKRFGIYCEKEGYAIETDVEDDLMVNADETQMSQVIYNLIGNAVNYTGDDKKIRISLRLHDNAVRFEVKDSGNGISAEELPFVWDKYYRSAKNHKRETVGTGVGLSIVKQILESHGAEYGVDSSDIGCTFYFEISDCR